MGRLRGFLWLIAGIVVAAVAGAVAYITFTNMTTNEILTGQVTSPTRSVVVTVTSLRIRDMLTAEDLALREMSVDDIPDGAFEDIEQVIGKITLVDLYPGEVVLDPRLLDPNTVSADGRLGLFVSEDKVLMAFPAAGLLNSVGILKPGDHIDFLYSYNLPENLDAGFLPGPRTTDDTLEEESPTELVTFSLMQNVSIAAIIGGYSEEEDSSGNPIALLLIVNPQDALVLKHMTDIGANFDAVLRAPESEGEFEVEPVDLEYIINGYIIPGETVP